MAEAPSYRFEPLDRRGVLLGLGASQVAVLALAVVAALGLVTSWPGGGGFSAAAATLALGGLLCRPVAGRAPPQWLRLAASFGGRRRAVALPPPGLSPGLVLRLPTKTFAAGVYLCELPAMGGHGPVGALLDERSGTAAAILRAKGSSFCLLDDVDKEHRLAAWAAVLESVSTHSNSLVRLQWCQRALPADSAPLIAHLRTTGDAMSPGYGGHASLVGNGGVADLAPRDLGRRNGPVPHPGGSRTTEPGGCCGVAERSKRSAGNHAKRWPGVRRSARRAGHSRRARQFPRTGPGPGARQLSLASRSRRALGRAPG